MSWGSLHFTVFRNYKLPETQGLVYMYVDFLHIGTCTWDQLHLCVCSITLWNCSEHKYTKGAHCSKMHWYVWYTFLGINTTMEWQEWDNLWILCEKVNLQCVSCMLCDACYIYMSVCHTCVNGVVTHKRLISGLLMTSPLMTETLQSVAEGTLSTATLTNCCTAFNTCNDWLCCRVSTKCCINTWCLWTARNTAENSMYIHSLGTILHSTHNTKIDGGTYINFFLGKEFGVKQCTSFIRLLPSIYLYKHSIHIQAFAW